MAERIPNQEALELAPVAGWIMLFLAVCAATIFIVNREGWRRFWYRTDDPRAMGLFRIAFGICAMCNINGLWELFGYLFTDEGLFLTDVARQVFAREQFLGFGNGLDGDPYGFMDAAGVWQWLKGPKYSLLFFWDTPTAWWIHWTVWQAATLSLIVGFKTRYTKWVAWFLFHSIILRNNVYWEGTENIYRTFFFYLCLSKCGHAYSVDNWLRCRRLRAKGLLSEPGGPGGGAGLAPNDEHPKGLEAIYRRIPAWPRLLVVLQCAALYCYTGVVKNGGVWWNGDAFYYAFNLDHFHRIPPQVLSSYLGTNLFKLNTHVTHAWEALFPLCVVALVIRFGLREKLPPLSRRARRIHRVAWVCFGLGALALCEWLYPVHFRQPRGSWWNLQKLQIAFGIAWVLGMVMVAWGWQRLRHRPFRFRLRGKDRVVDLDTFLKWTLGRRIWVTLGIVFHMHLIVQMNIGWFSPGGLTGFICFLGGAEVAVLLLVFARKLRLTKAEHPIPSEDPTLPYLKRDTARLPMASMVIAVALAVVAVILQYKDVLAYGWSLVGIAAFLAGSMAREARATRGKGDGPRPLAYGPLGRFVVGSLLIYQVVGVACWLLPDKDSFTWRTQTHKPFKWWLKITQTTQGWKMFAPNPPRSNLFLRVLVTDMDGETWDMNTDVYAPEQRPIPWIWYTRQRKINRRVAGGEGGKGSWYQKWHARWFCRTWELEHEGERAKHVELVKITYRIPSPRQVRKNGPYDPVEHMRTKSTQRSIYTATCETEVGAQTPNVIRARHGLDPVQKEKGIRRWNMLRNKKSRWERRKERDRKKNK